MKMNLDVFPGLRKKMNSTEEEGMDAHDLHMGNLSKEEKQTKRAWLERKEKKMGREICTASSPPERKGEERGKRKKNGPC